MRRLCLLFLIHYCFAGKLGTNQGYSRSQLNSGRPMTLNNAKSQFSRLQAKNIRGNSYVNENLGQKIRTTDNFYNTINGNNYNYGKNSKCDQ